MGWESGDGRFHIAYSNWISPEQRAITVIANLTMSGPLAIQLEL